MGFVRFDAVAGLNYNYFRDFDPSMGRYVQTDPIGLGGGEDWDTHFWPQVIDFS